MTGYAFVRFLQAAAAGAAAGAAAAAAAAAGTHPLFRGMLFRGTRTGIVVVEQADSRPVPVDRLPLGYFAIWVQRSACVLHI